MSLNSLPNEMIILAGGFGTRLQPVVSDVPKPMALVEGRPFLAYLLDYWIEQGIHRFIISTGHLASVIGSYFGSSYRSASIAYVHEQTPLGTGGALRLALDSMTYGGQLALMANGDTWFPVQLRKLFDDAANKSNTITLALKKLEKNDRYGGVVISAEGQITAFGDKATSDTYINAGCYLFNVSALKKAFASMPATFSLENDFLVPFSSDGLVGSSIHDQPFLDIGIPEDYQRAFEFLK